MPTFCCLCHNEFQLATNLPACHIYTLLQTKLDFIIMFTFILNKKTNNALFPILDLICFSQLGLSVRDELLYPSNWHLVTI